MIELWKKCDFYERIIIVVFLSMIINAIFGLDLYTSSGIEYPD